MLLIMAEIKAITEYVKAVSSVINKRFEIGFGNIVNIERIIKIIRQNDWLLFPNYAPHTIYKHCWRSTVLYLDLENRLDSEQTNNVDLTLHHLGCYRDYDYRKLIIVGGYSRQQR